VSWRCRDGGAEDYASIREIAAETFPDVTLLPRERFLPLLTCRPALVRVLERTAGAGKEAALYGYYALWPMARSALEGLAAGLIRERDLGESELLDPADSRAQVLYVMDICVRRSLDARSSARLVLDLREGLRRMLEVSPQLAIVAAWAYTSQGERLAAKIALGPYGEDAGAPRVWLGRRDAVLKALGSAASNRRDQEVKMNNAVDPRPIWAASKAEWAEAAKFFARVISQDDAYISHGEIQTGLSLDGKSWAPNLEQRFLAELGGVDDTRSLVLLRDAEGKIVAAANVTWSFETADAPFATLQDMAVEPALRAGGIGARLMQAVEHEAARRGAKWMFLESGKDNHRGHAFFERHGYSEVSRVFIKAV
jgi:GNAT superfamily N-acetyltransferase